MKSIIKIALIILAIYVFITLIIDTDFSGMSFSEIKLVVTIFAGIAVAIVSATKGMNIIRSAGVGFVTGAITYALLSGLVAVLKSI